jgi:glucose/arabinose dehydrogenase
LLYEPEYEAFDGSGDLWVTSPVNNTVLEYTPSQLTSSGYPTPSVVISMQSFPAGLAFHSGNLWVNSGGKVVEYTTSQLASSGSPTPSIAITISGLNYPAGLSFDGSGDLWVATGEQPGNVLEYTPSQLASSGSPTPDVTIGGLSQPLGLSFDGSGDLWVANSFNDTLVDYTPSQLASSGSPTPNVTISGLSEPRGLAFDGSADLWVTNYINDTFVEYTPSQLASSGSPTPNVTISGSGPRGPWGLSVDGSSDLWVDNSGANTVIEYTPSQLASNGSPNPNVTISSPQYLWNPDPVALDQAGDLWVGNVGNNTVTEYTPSQLASSGSPTPNVTISGSGINSPTGMTFDGSGDLWVTSFYDQAVVEYTPSQLASSGSPTPKVTVSGLNNPEGLAFDASGDLWAGITDANIVVEYTPSQLASSGSPVPHVTISGLTAPHQPSFDSSGDLWVLSTSSFAEYTPSQLTSSGSPIPKVTISGLNSPDGRAFDASGDLWITNSLDSLVEYTPSQLASSGSPTPATTLSGSATGLGSPFGIAIKSSASVPSASELAFTLGPVSEHSTSSTQTILVSIEDSNGNVVTSDTGRSVTLAIETKPESGVLTCTSGLTVTDSNGVATFNGCAISAIGDGYTLIATAAGLTSAVSGSFDISGVTPYPTRIFGIDAIATSLAVSASEFPTTGTAGAVVLARSDFFSDALAGGPLAAAVNGPLLITPGAGMSSTLDSRVQTEIQRVLPTGKTVYILGGDLALSPTIDITLRSLGYSVVREAGADEYATAVDIAKQLGNPSKIFEATGLSFYDALSAVPAAIKEHAAILLTNGSSQAPETATYLAQFPGDARYAIGGPLTAFGADPGATPVYGQDLFNTSAAVATRFFPAPSIFGAATAANFPDALGGGVFMDTGTRSGPLLLVNQSTPLPPEITPYLAGLALGSQGYVFGGPLAVGPAVLTALQSAVG